MLEVDHAHALLAQELVWYKGLCIQILASLVYTQYMDISPVIIRLFGVVFGGLVLIVLLEILAKAMFLRLLARHRRRKGKPSNVSQFDQKKESRR